MYLCSIYTTTERAGLGVTQQTCILEVLGLMSVGALTILTKIFPGFSKSLQKNAGIVPWLDYDRFLTNSYQYIIHTSVVLPYDAVLLDTKTVEK
jgi:hypothetical protein